MAEGGLALPCYSSLDNMGLYGVQWPRGITGSGDSVHRCCDGEMAPAFTSEELERLVDGVLPQYGLLYEPPDQQVSTPWARGM
ncbi:hypothetical protein NDU88_001827 [Pleurodeles waltl]|uniref:Uncharacterized protein n=1 Tax=Pleurodeles waltl TaxID=8319 RepID=A0AAV7LAM8_PLEWA|nr:hypothetical protein NDU88_001827 [Pleurodeles waltl]